MKTFILGATFFVAACLWALQPPVPVPVVYWSTASDECKSAFIKGEQVPCSDVDFNKPFEKVWVL